MESLENILNRYQAHSQRPARALERLKAYIGKKHGFEPDISLSPRRITIYAPTAAQASVLRLDWSNLNQLLGEEQRSIYIKLKQP